MSINDSISSADSLNQISERLAALEKELKSIRERNLRVEASKEWETSRARLFSITGITYVTMLLVFMVLGSSKPFADALVPTTGFFLSTLSLSFLRDRFRK